MLFLFVLGTMTLLPGVCILKEKYLPADIVILALSLVVVNYFQYFSPTVSIFMTFSILLVSYWYSDRNWLISFSKSCLFFINQLIVGMSFFDALLSSSVHALPWISPIYSSLLLDAVLLCILSKVEKVIIDRLRKRERPFLLYFWSIICFAGFSLDFYFFRMVEFSERDSTSHFSAQVLVVTIILFLLFLLITILSQRIYQDRLAVEKERFSIENEHKYHLNLIKNAEDTRKIKHDLKNILTGMELYMQEGDMRQLIDYYETAVKPLAKRIEGDQSRLGLIKKFQDLPIQSLLIEKFGNLRNKKINVIIDVPNEVSFSVRDIPNVQRGLGIIIDNALQEVSELGAGDIFLSCRRDHTHWQIVVENTCRKDIQPIHQLKAKGYTTKTDGQGLGLMNLEEIFESDRYLLSTFIKGRRFVQNISILE